MPFLMRGPILNRQAPQHWGRGVLREQTGRWTPSGVFVEIVEWSCCIERNNNRLNMSGSKPRRHPARNFHGYTAYNRRRIERHGTDTLVCIPGIYSIHGGGRFIGGKGVPIHPIWPTCNEHNERHDQGCVYSTGSSCCDVSPLVLLEDGRVPAEDAFNPRQHRRQERQNQEQHQRTGAAVRAHLWQEQLEYLWHGTLRTTASTMSIKRTCYPCSSTAVVANTRPKDQIVVVTESWGTNQSMQLPKENAVPNDSSSRYA